MFELLEKIRAKSPRVKKQIAFLLSFSFAGIIFTVWVMAIYPNFKSVEDKNAQVAKLEPSPTGAFINIISSSFSAVANKVSSAKEALTSFSTSMEHYSATTTPEDNTASVISSLSTTTSTVSTTTEQ
jgi:hypothetical protein